MCKHVWLHYLHKHWALGVFCIDEKSTFPHPDTFQSRLCACWSCANSSCCCWVASWLIRVVFVLASHQECHERYVWVQCPAIYRIHKLPVCQPSLPLIIAPAFSRLFKTFKACPDLKCFSSLDISTPGSLHDCHSSVKAFSEEFASQVGWSLCYLSAISAHVPCLLLGDCW